MGLFLQKTNIIRDYLEARLSPASLSSPSHLSPRRTSWRSLRRGCSGPASCGASARIYSLRRRLTLTWRLRRYAKTLADFKQPERSAQAVFCLNHLVGNALSHATESLEYLSRLRDPQVFRFCAIPQVMAIATLAGCYGNHGVFTSVVKIPRSQAARIMVTTRSFADVLAFFRMYARQLEIKARSWRAAASTSKLSASSQIRDTDPSAATARATLAALSDALLVRAALCMPCQR